jgi:PKD repeat protein
MNQENQMPENKDNFYTTPDLNNQVEAGFNGNNTAETSKPFKKSKSPNRGLMLALLSGFGLMVLVILFSAFLYFTSKGSSSSVLGLSSTSFMNFLLLGLGIAFVVGALVSLIVFVVSLFKFMTAKNSQPGQKKKFFVRLVIALVSLILTTALAIFTLMYADTDFGGPMESGIITTPAETLGLSAPVTITFDATQLPIDEMAFDIVSYRWDFGDGATATGPVVEHEFMTKPESGFYETTLRVNVQEAANPQAEIQGIEYKRTIGIENQRVVPVITVEPEQGRAPLTVNFDASQSVDPDGSIISYEWDFNGDEITDEEGQIVEYTFEEAGEYEVKLYLVDSNGESVEATETVNVLSEDIIKGVILNVPNDEILTPGRTYTFDGSTSESEEGTIESFEWDFGDGQIRSGNKVSYSFADEGVYQVLLRLNDSEGNEVIVTREYIVSNSPSGLFATIQTEPSLADGQETLVGQAPFTVMFDAGSSSSTGANIVEYKWDFENDGVIDDNGQTVEHVFTDAGEYEVELSITSSDGRTATKTLSVLATGTGIQPIVTAEPNVGTVPLTVTFDATATQEASDSNIVSFRWNFGDGTPIRKGLPVMTHRFDRVGDYTVEVTAITDTNETATTEVLVFVNPVPLQACFETSRDSGTDEVTVSFDPSCTTGPATKFTWEFGDGETSIERRPVHTFRGAGEYTVQLEVASNENDISVFEKVIVVE